MSQPQSKFEEIRLIMKEKEEMVIIGQEIVGMLPRLESGRNLGKPPENAPEIVKKVLEFCSHLSNVASFCDKQTRTRVYAMVDLLDQMTLDYSRLGLSGFVDILRSTLLTAVSIQLDFDKKPPFRAIGFDMKALGARMKAFAKR